MAREIYMIDKYNYTQELTLSDHGVYGFLSLWNESNSVANFKFKSDTVEFRPFRYGGDGVVRGDISKTKHAAIIDLLRNEKPIRLLVFHDGSSEKNISAVRIGTDPGPLEPVGEGED